MTLEEALEYLNLPANSRRALIRKRYLELKKDYLKAIYNAPSDHFSSLYRENLQKIEEAYEFLIDQIDGFNDEDSQFQQTITQIQHMVNSFLENKKVLDEASKTKILACIDQIDQLKSALRKERRIPNLSLETSRHQVWHWETDKLKKDKTVKSIPGLSAAPEKSAQPTFNQSLGESNRVRKYRYDRILMGIILAIVILGALGALYVLFPLFS